MSERSVGAADWITNLDPSGLTVASYVLSRHDAAIRVLNPARAATGRTVTWREVGGASYRPRSDLQWKDLVKSAAYESVEEPAMGTIDDDVTVALLRNLTRPDERIQVAQWEGYADVEFEERLPRAVFPPERSCVLRTVLAHDLIQVPRKPMRWWSSDLTWTAANDIYGRSIFISADTATITTLLGDSALEAFPVNFQDPVTPEDR